MTTTPEEVPPGLRGRRVAVLVAGGIAAYKVCAVVSQLTQAGCAVRVAMTEAALRFVGEATLRGLSGNPVLTDLWMAGGAAEPHVELGDWAEIALVAPATAHTLARLAHGMGDDIVTATCLAARCPVVVAPAMNDAMWGKEVVAGNVAALRRHGLTVVEPASGRLASGHVGSGRLPEGTVLLAAMEGALGGRGDLRGRRVVITAGGTREAIDPVRFISNYSSGRMGFALAAAAAERGAEAVLISAATHPPHAGVEVIAVESAEEMLASLRRAVPGADLLMMAAAVADYRPAERSETKIRRENREELVLRLERNPDLLASLSGLEGTENLFRLGFAAEGEDLWEHTQEKLRRKGLDAILGNDIRRTDIAFGSEHNAGTLLFRDGTRIQIERVTKREMADRILDAVVPRLPAR